MKNWIKYIFNIDIQEITKIKQGFLLYASGNYYYLKSFNEEKYDYGNLKKIFKTINEFKTPYYTIILNNKKEIICEYDNNKYFLMLIKGIINQNVSIDEFYFLDANLIAYLNYKQISWNELWSKKIDYIEMQIADFAKSKNETIESFAFFSGLAENAISFLNQNSIEYKKATLSFAHTRIYYPNKAIDYYDPTNLIIDYKIRDFAEYIKSKIFSGFYPEKELKYIYNTILVNKNDALLFYARLMFLSTYFDSIEEILIDDKCEKTLDNYLLNLNIYMDVLKDVYYEISKK